MTILNTFVKIAPDCPATTGTPPASRGDKATVAEIEYLLLAGRPYKLTQDELIFQTHVRRTGLSAAEARRRRQEIWAALFSRPHPCLRASALTKRYGWGVHYDSEGRIALHGAETPTYARLSAPVTATHKVLSAMRNQRPPKT